MQYSLEDLDNISSSLIIPVDIETNEEAFIIHPGEEECNLWMDHIF